jgi:hypothetical protein
MIPTSRLLCRHLSVFSRRQPKQQKIENFGLRLSERRLLSNLGPDGLLAREQQTVRKAMEALAHYIGLHSDGIILRIENRDDLVVISPVVSAQRGRPCVRRRN